MTDPQFEILRTEIRDGFKASVQRDAALSQKLDAFEAAAVQRDAALSQKLDAVEARLADVSYALHSVMNTLLAPAENRDIRSKMKTPHEAADVQREVR